MRKAKVADLERAIMEELSQYKQEVTDGLKEEIQTTANECKKEVEANIVAENLIETGDYKKGWRVGKAYESKEDIRIVIHNKTDYQLAHLLEYGHAKQNGGSVEGRPHIRPAEQNAEKKLMKRVKVIVRK